MIAGLLVAGLLPFLGAVVLNFVSAPRSARAGWIASAFVVASFALICFALPTEL